MSQSEFMTLGELRKATHDMPDESEIILFAYEKDGTNQQHFRLHPTANVFPAPRNRVSLFCIKRTIEDISNG